MQTMIPRPAAVPEVGLLAGVLAGTEPELWAEALPGESPIERQARQDAAAHILDDLRYDLDGYGCEGHCCCCGGDGRMGSGTCPLCHGTGICGCHA